MELDSLVLLYFISCDLEFWLYFIVREFGKWGFFWVVVCLVKNEEFYYYWKKERMDIGCERVVYVIWDRCFYFYFVYEDEDAGLERRRIVLGYIVRSFGFFLRILLFFCLGGLVFRKKVFGFRRGGAFILCVFISRFCNRGLLVFCIVWVIGGFFFLMVILEYFWVIIVISV